LRHFHERKLIALYVCGRETSYTRAYLRVLESKEFHEEEITLEIRLHAIIFHVDFDVRVYVLEFFLELVVHKIGDTRVFSSF